MDEKQALDVINQGINLSVSNGAFKNARDVAIISQALEVLAQFLVAVGEAQKERLAVVKPTVGQSEAKEKDVMAPKKKAIKKA